MTNSGLQDRDKYTVWVTITWLLAGIAVVASLVMITKLGQIEVPNRSGYGTRTEANIFIWAICIGQSIGSILLAALFSMVNSIYQNSCEVIDSTQAPFKKRNENKKPESRPISDSKNDGYCLKVMRVKNVSQLFGILKPGHKLLSVNGQKAGNIDELESLVVSGDNIFEYYDVKGNYYERAVRLKPGPLRIEVEAIPLK